MKKHELIAERKAILLDLIEKGEIQKLGEFTNEHGELYFVIRGANTVEYPNCVALVGDETDWEPIMTLEGFNITEEEHKKMLEIVSQEEWESGKPYKFTIKPELIDCICEPSQDGKKEILS